MLRKDLDAYVFLAILNAAVFFLFSSPQLKLDYKAFYSAGRAAMASPARAYDPDQQFSSAGLWNSRDTALTYYHPPHELLLLGPLSLLPYRTSLAVWRMLSVVCFVLATLLLARTYELPFKRVFSFSAAIFGVTFCLLEGQDSLLMLLLLSASLYFAQRRSDLAAGCLLGVSLFKPQIPIIIAVAMLVSGRRRFALSFACTAAVIGTASFAVIGGQGLRQMLDLLRTAEMREVPSQMISLRGLFSFFPNGQLLSVIASAGLIASFVLVWRKLENVAALYGSAILVGALSAFHFHGQDVSMLVIPMLLLARKSQHGFTTEAAMWSLLLSPLFLFLLYWGVPGLLALSVLVLTLRVWRDVYAEGNTFRSAMPPVPSANLSING